MIFLYLCIFQVQFRLRQVVDAPVNDKDALLKDLEEFAFRGIPEVKGPQYFHKDDKETVLLIKFFCDVFLLSYTFDIFVFTRLEIIRETM